MEVHWGYRYPYIYTVWVWLAAILVWSLYSICILLMLVAAPFALIAEKLEGYETPIAITKHLWKGVRQLADRS